MTLGDTPETAALNGQPSSSNGFSELQRGAIIASLPIGKEGLPHDAIRVARPALVEIGATTLCLAFMGRRRIGLCLSGSASLQARHHRSPARPNGQHQEVQKRPLASLLGFDREINAGIVEHPFVVIRLAHCRRSAKHLSVETRRLLQVPNAQIDVKSLHPPSRTAVCQPARQRGIANIRLRGLSVLLFHKPVLLDGVSQLVVAQSQRLGCLALVPTVLAQRVLQDGALMTVDRRA